jgi:hypothetical protein
MDRLRCAHCGEVIGVYEHPPDNHLILMSRQAQLAALTDLLLHSNLFFLVFEDGETGKGSWACLTTTRSRRSRAPRTTG